MKLYYAPMEGFTDAVFRRVHSRFFPWIGKYFMPFISPSASLSFTKREMYDLSPGANAGVPAVPQILAKDPVLFLGAARMLRDMGYREINLNLGCPSSTVTAKGKGAGALRDLDALERFLHAVFTACPLPLSVKSRIGMEEEGEWPGVLRLLSRYPFSEWILHPRTGREQYRFSPRSLCFDQARRAAPFPVIYNGDLFTAPDAWDFLTDHPGTEGIMLGRGLMTNPALGREILGGEALTMEELIAFHDALLREYLVTWPESAAVGRMHAIMGYLGHGLRYPAKRMRQLRQAADLDGYTDAAAALFSESEPVCPPRFIPPA